MYDRAHYILQKTCDRARRDRYKNVKLQLNPKGVMGLGVQIVYHEPKHYDSTYFIGYCDLFYLTHSSSKKRWCA
jgi:hypothetical protein